MQFTFAMAGLAEAAFLYGLVIIGAILFIVGGLLAFAWWKCSNVAATITVFLILSVGLFLQPWTAFGPPATNDPDEAYWIVRLRVASGVWLFLLIAGVACLIRVTRRRKSLRHISSLYTSVTVLMVMFAACATPNSKPQGMDLEGPPQALVPREVSGTSSGEPPRVFISREVRISGWYAWTNGMKLADAVQAAGGFTEFAGRSRIEIRNIDGTFRTYNFNNQNPALRPGDVVHIIGSLD